ncbi:hypothetical protein [Streptomyces sp. NRRL S-1022]|uniref:hypothetical protein n=1 Tax=Streptomyces sp. NRRL S-1022 TaxID=1463880 RepID=UPI00131D3F9A|nr:hypothetical protein [Streptomyces sp. NRRL S-1022]
MHAATTAEPLLFPGAAEPAEPPQLVELDPVADAEPVTSRRADEPTVGRASRQLPLPDVHVRSFRAEAERITGGGLG